MGRPGPALPGKPETITQSAPRQAGRAERPGNTIESDWPNRAKVSRPIPAPPSASREAELNLNAITGAATAMAPPIPSSQRREGSR